MNDAQISQRPGAQSVFSNACTQLESILTGSDRENIVKGICRTKTLPASLLLLRRGMRSNLFKNGGKQVSLAKIVRSLGDRAVKEGFHVLQDWDGKADKLHPETIPVDILDYSIAAKEIGGDGHSDKTILAILLDYYFLYLLALLSLRLWDEGNADENLDRLNSILHRLQGPSGSGHRFVDNAETLIFIATSHYEVDERAYDKLLAKTTSLSSIHRLNLALAHAGILGCHLRYGFEAQYGWDIAAMRRDNAPDYAWLSIALAILMKAYSRFSEEGVDGVERERVVEGVLSGLSADARSFFGKPADSLAAHTAELSQFSELFQRYREDLFRDFERHRSSLQAYAPLALRFNFPHNVLKGIVVDALLRGKAGSVSLNDLLTGIPRNPEAGKSKEGLARSLTALGQANPDRVRGRAVPAILYDQNSGVRSFAKMLLTIQGLESETKPGMPCSVNKAFRYFS